MPTNPLILYSRSAVTTDWTCPRKRYWQYEHHGRGITSDSTSLALFLGQTLHSGIAGIAHGVSIDEIAPAAVAEVKAMLMANSTAAEPDALHYASEQAALVEGLLRGFQRHVWPIFMRSYEVVGVEQEMTYEHDGLTFMAKPDLLLRDKEGALWYPEFKSTSSNQPQWINSWATAIQLHSSIRAAEATLGEKVTGVIVQGLYKGYFSKQYGRQESAFCHAYHRPAEPPFTPAVWQHTYKAGLKKFPIWEREGGVRQWVAEMPEDILSQQFPQVPPIFINDALVDAFFRQRAVREHEIKDAIQFMKENMHSSNYQHTLDEVFPQAFEQCTKAWGSDPVCEFKKLCHGRIDDPLTAGFRPRTSHHAMEEEMLNAKG